MATLDGGQQRPRANAGEEDDDIERAVDQGAGKPFGVLIRLDRHLAQRGSQKACAAKLRDERRDFRCSTALEREDARTIKARARSHRRLSFSASCSCPDWLSAIRAAERLRARTR